jgi:D-sedoheptulose 7-phosphate isomerase
MQITEYTRNHLIETSELSLSLDGEAIDNVIYLLRDTRDRGGRIFFLGVGGSAANASHAANDFRKIAGIECYSPVDNVAELTARINDDGWETCYANFLLASRLSAADTVFVLSVGGGNVEANISVNLVESLRVAKAVGASIAGIVGRDGGFTAKMADACVIIPTISSETITAHTESFQAIVWHLIVSHPLLKRNEMKWERTNMAGSEQSFSIATV